MAEFYAIVTNFGNAARAQGRLDVGVDTRTGVGVNVLFNVYDAAGTQLSEFSVPTNANGLASSSAVAANDLFALSGGAPALVRARTAQSTVNAFAALHQTGPGNRLSLNVAPTKKLDGTLLSAGKLFSIAVGDVPAPALLIANVSGSDSTADVFVGTEGVPGGGRFTNARIPNHGIWRVDLTDAEKNSNIVILTSGIVVAQLALDDGNRVTALTCIPTA